MSQKLRLYSGLILFAFVLCHLLNHALGLVSVSAMEIARPYFMGLWNNLIGTILLISSMLVHFFMALYVVFKRRSLKLKRWEIIQLVFGLAIPLLLANHIIATVVSENVLGTDLRYPHTMASFWVVVPYLGFLQAVSLIVVWVHGCVGIHFWLKTKAFYPDCRWMFAQLAVIIPTLSLAGFISAGFQTRELAIRPTFLPDLYADANVTMHTASWVAETTLTTRMVIAFLIILPFILRMARHIIQRLQKRPKLQFADGRSFRIHHGATVLETLRENKVEMASVCGGRGRCTTCRVHVSSGLENLPETEKTEADALQRIDAMPSVRLACQLRPTADVSLTPLMPANASAKDGRRPGGLDGMEMKAAFMFVDLRGSTKLGEEKLPFDVLYILNQFFAEMTLSLKATSGHYAQFNGDGLMAIYGLNGAGKAIDHAQNAIRGAEEMFRRLDLLNEQLESELDQPLKIGIGIHYGEAIVGAMGPPDNQLITAIGDNVNIAARLESLCKEYQSPLIISADAASAANITLPESQAHSVAVKGRNQEVKFYGLQTAPKLQ